jgi:NAD+ synthase
MKKIETFNELVDIVGEITTPSVLKVDNIISNIRKHARKYIKDNGLKSLVVGISGGLDSSVIASLLSEKHTGVPLIGVSIPMHSTIEHKEQAQWIGDTFCSTFEEFNEFDKDEDLAQQLFYSVSKLDNLAKESGIDISKNDRNIFKGNIKARMRMISLYHLANVARGMVLSTDNYSEYLMGFWTLNGDVGNYAPIQQIFKGFELPAIARELGIRDDIIGQAPSDGLMVTEQNTDEAQLGGTYKEVDTIMLLKLGLLSKYYGISINEEEFYQDSLIELEHKFTKVQKKVTKIQARYRNTEFKRNDPYILDRTLIF